MSDEIMQNIQWVFGKKQYTSYDDFASAVTTYNRWATAGEASRVLADQVSEVPIRVIYDPAWTNSPALEFHVGATDSVLTVGRVLFELNNATLELFRSADKRFFEGLRKTGPTEYRLRTGS